MSLHKWHNENEMVLTTQQFTMRLSNNGTDLQWHSPVTIMHSSITMTVEGDTIVTPSPSTLSTGTTLIDNAYVLTSLHFDNAALPNLHKARGLDNSRYCYS
eukprot:2125819-Amphidinium_carterae.1